MSTLPQTKVQSTEQFAADSAARGSGVVRPPYPPGWLDRLFAWVEGLPFPAWSFYLVCWLPLMLAETLTKWADAAYPVGTIFPIHAVHTGLPIYVLATAHYLDRLAGEQMRAFRSVFLGDDAAFERLSYELTTTPAHSALLAGLAGAGGGAIVSVLLPPSITEAQKLFTSPVSTLLDATLLIGLWALLATVMYRTVRQLRLVSHIYAQHTRIDLFRLGPLYAFSTLTARTALSIMFALYVWFAVDPSPILANVPFAGAVAAFGLAALITFARPLLDLHELLAQEKRRLQDENGEQLKNIVAELHQRTGAGEYSRAGELEAAMNSLIAERDVLTRLRTWPWETETARLVVTAAMLPMLLWLVQRLLERLGI
ncbi:MAG: hypothetical protein M3437_08730 [Chloroflexota bacterium]|nr:hypothetical protein [Chloroflexota bacterium]MDQ5864529.1 hypothetical protein [Chloroflexota bacterium]